MAANLDRENLSSSMSERKGKRLLSSGKANDCQSDRIYAPQLVMRRLDPADATVKDRLEILAKLVLPLLHRRHHCAIVCCRGAGVFDSEARVYQEQHARVLRYHSARCNAAVQTQALEPRPRWSGEWRGFDIICSHSNFPVLIDACVRSPQLHVPS